MSMSELLSMCMLVATSWLVFYESEKVKKVLRYLTVTPELNRVIKDYKSAMRICMTQCYVWTGWLIICWFFDAPMTLSCWFLSLVYAVIWDCKYNFLKQIKLVRRGGHGLER